VDEYLCVTVTSRPGESADDFHRRLISFWSGVIRTRPEEYKLVYAESTRFEPAGDRVTRQYFVGTEAAEAIETELAAAGIEHTPIDREELFSKYEATPPDWFQIPH
jgi:hypothetical protein